LIRLNNRAQHQEYKRFRAALAASPDAFIVFDQNKKVVFVSEHYKRVYPDHTDVLTPGTPVEKAYESLSSTQNVFEDSEVYDEFREFWTTLSGQIEFTLDDGRTWRVTAAELPDQQGYIVTTTDITDYLDNQKLLEEKSEALEMALVQEKEASEIQKQFINMVSHEFRTPLTIIDGNAQIIQKRADQMDQEQINKKVKSIRSAVSRLIYMMDGILSSNMLSSGNMELMPENLDVKALVSELAEEQEQLSPSLEINLHMETLPESLLLDKKVMTLILTNLISNAIKFSDQNPRINIYGDARDDMFVLKVEDQGIGIPEGELSKIFDRYYRSSISENVTGSGIGLNLVKGLVELHGGSVEVDSKQGQGSSFTVKIPL
jgi:signal transduction histidine kinase